MKDRMKGFATLLDSHERAIQQRLPKYAAGFSQRVGEIRNRFEGFFDKANRIKTSGHYSSAGEKAELRSLMLGVKDEIAKFKKATVGALAAQLADARSAALAPRRPIENEVLRFLRLQEYRTKLEKLDPLDLKARLKQAVADGGDFELIEALESAPKGFPIVSPDLIAETKAAIAERDHPEIGELAQLHQAYDYLANIASEEVRAMAEQERIDVWDDSSLKSAS